MLYGALKDRHPEYDPVVWSEIWCLYKGGYAIMRRAKDFLLQLDGETPKRYADRLRLVAYVGYLAEIVDFFRASLFNAELQVTQAVDAKDKTTPGEEPNKPDFWQQFADDADLQRTPFSQVMGTAVRDALLKRRALIQLDMPAATTQARSRAEEKQAGTDRVYAYNVDLECLIDWKCDDYGRFEWVLLYETSNERKQPDKPRRGTLHTWTLWTLDLPEGMTELPPPTTPGKASGAIARWRRFEFQETEEKKLEAVQPDEDIPTVDEGTTSFDRIPLIRLELPEGLWAGNYLGPLAREHWARRSMLVGAEGRHMTSLPYVSLSGDDDGLGAEALTGEARKALRDQFGDAPTVPGTIQYAEPTGMAYEVVDKQLDKLKDEMFRIAHQMAMSVDNSSSSMKRSGTSKQQDKKDVAVVLGALSTHVKDAAEEVYEVAAIARAEADVVWEARGLDRFVDTDRGEVVEEATAAPIILEAIPSPTFKKQYLSQLAEKLAPNIDPVTQDTIRDEIEDGVDAHQELDDKTLENAKDDADDHVTPGDKLKAQKQGAIVQATSAKVLKKGLKATGDQADGSES